MQTIDGNTLKVRIGKLIAQKRKSLNISQEALAEKLNIHVRTIGKIEQGRSFVTAETLCKLSEVFNMPIKSFFEVENSVNSKQQNLNLLMDKLQSYSNDKTELYLSIINLIDTKLTGIF